MLVLLPYYILRYESKISKLENNEVEQEKLFQEYASIEKSLREVADENVYTHLIDMMNKILQYEFRKTPKLKEGMEKVMVGEVFELYSTRMLRQGLEQGLEQGREQERIAILQKLTKQNKMSLEDALELLEIPTEEHEKYQEKLQEYQQKEVLEQIPNQKARKR